MEMGNDKTKEQNSRQEVLLTRCSLEGMLRRVMTSFTF